MITKEEIKEILRESTFTTLYGMGEDEIEQITQELLNTYDLVGEVYAG